MRVAATALAAALMAAGLYSGPSLAADTIKIAYIDPLSGGGASVGEVGLQHLQFFAERINAAGGLLGKKVEIIGLDNKTNPQESLIQAQKAVDMGARIITQGNGSAVALALSDFVTKFGDRNPGKELVYLNYAAVDPALTNDKCSFWHFRFDANSDIKMAALTTFMKDRPAIKKVYLINQDYSFGQSVRAQARAMLKEKRPDIQIVGDELHPLLKITDFAPYVAKIKASGADTIITGNWGQDIALLLKAAADAGLQTDWYTYYAGGAGGPTAIKQTGLQHRVFQIAESYPNYETPDAAKLETEFRAKYHTGLWYPRLANEMDMLAKAIKAAKTDDARSIALALEGMKSMPILDGGEMFMRKDDHQLYQTMFIGSFGPMEPGQKFDEENTGWGWKKVGTVDAKETVLPTTCKMDRPS